MLTTGIKGNKMITVTDAMSAKSMGSGELEVYATPSLIALAEETAWRSVAEYLESGQGTVGTRIDIRHLAATPVGMTVRCETELTQIDRRKLTFSVAVYDETEKAAEGTHERFIVENEKFQAKAQAKRSS